MPFFYRRFLAQRGCSLSQAGAGHALLKRVVLLSSLLLSAAVSLTCGSNKNHADRKGWGDFADSDWERSNCVNQQTCTPDPGPREQTLAECQAAEEGLEFSVIWQFEGSAPGMYAYDDKTTYEREPTGFEPPTQSIRRCGTDTGAFHTYGGPFLAWGGGFGRGVEGMCNTDNHPLCAPITPDSPTTFDENNGVDRPARWIDATQWEGISFWARRGPDSQSGIRLSIADSNLDADVSFARYYANPAAPRTCERIKQCGCRNHKPCTKYTGPPLYRADSSGVCESDVTRNVISSIVREPLPTTDANGVQTWATETEDYYFCYDPATDPAPECFQSDAKFLTAHDADGNELRYEWCGATVCNSFVESFQAIDKQFHGKPCTEFTYRTGLTDSYCYDPAVDPEPVPTSQECGDMWMKGVSLSTDWQFFKIPFSALLQQGWAKEFHNIRIDQISTIRFTYDRGYIDYWIDDVRFYRQQGAGAVQQGTAQ